MGVAVRVGVRVARGEGVRARALCNHSLIQPRSPLPLPQMIQGLVMRMNWVLAPFGLFKYHFSGHRCTFVANYYQDDPNHAFNALMAGLTIVQASDGGYLIA